MWIKSYRTLLSILSLSVACAHNGFGQSNNDWQNWNKIGIAYKLNKKLDFELEQHLRLDEDFSEISEYFTQFETSYELFNNFKLGIGLRYIRENDNEGNVQGYENHFRYQLDAKYKHKINRFSLRYRLRYQNKNELGVDDNGEKQNIRLKTGLEYNIRKWKLDPQFAAEIFNRFGSEEGNYLSKYRLTFGTEYNFKKWGTLEAYYRFEKEINAIDPELINILGLKYTYTINN